MNLNDELRSAIKRAGIKDKVVGVKKVAEAFDVSESIIHKWVETGEHHRKNPMEDFLKLMEVLKWDPEFMRYICGLGGGCYVKDPPLKNGKAQDLMSVENDVMGNMGGLMKTISIAARDKNISSHKARDIRKGWDEVKSLTEGFVVGCEHGNFDAYHAHAAKLQAKQNGKALNGNPVSANPSPTLRV